MAQQTQAKIQPGPEIFLIFYIKRRIELGGQLQWYEAPYCCEENPPKEWLRIEKAARLFEINYNQQIRQNLILNLEKSERLNYESFQTIIRRYMASVLAHHKEEKAMLTLALIAFTGMYARRLAELDLNQKPGILQPIDYRRAIYQISIYGSHILLSIWTNGWKTFCQDVDLVLERLSLCKQCCSLARRLCVSICIGLAIGSIFGVYIFIL